MLSTLEKLDTAEFQTKVLNHIKFYENNPDPAVYKNHIHFCSSHVPTVAFGYALVEGSPGAYSLKQNIKQDLAHAEITISDDGIYKDPTKHLVN